MSEDDVETSFMGDGNSEDDERSSFIVGDKYGSDPVLVDEIITKASMTDNKEICGLTILDKELFVVSRYSSKFLEREKSSEVEVYDSTKYSFIRRWNLEELIDPRNIVTCNRNKCLYIIDEKEIYLSSEIMRVDPTGELIKKWKTGDKGFFNNISVTHESNVILAVFWKTKLNEYSPNGELIREIKLSSAEGIDHPWHAIKLTDGNFVVSHGYYNNSQHRVCLVDVNGKVKKSFGRKRGSSIGQLDWPLYFSVDKDGFVFVVDRKNHRVLLLDSNFKFKREIFSKEKNGLRVPYRIYLDESNSGRLFMIEYKTE